MVKTLKKSTVTHYYLRVFSRHPSAKGLLKKVLIKGKKVVYRHGSTTESSFKYEINSVQSVRNSADKRLMKKAFDSAGINHARWEELQNHNSERFNKFLKEISFGESAVIIKHRFGSRGSGNSLVKTKEQLQKFIASHQGTLGSYIVEEYKNYSVEYRLHITEYGCIYTCRKMLKSDTPDSEKFQRHDDNCVWYVESNPAFNKPANWDEIVKDCQKALKALGGDVMAFDVKCTSIKEKKDRKCKWIVIESCSAPSFGEGTTEHYVNELPKIIQRKYGI